MRAPRPRVRRDQAALSVLVLTALLLGSLPAWADSFEGEGEVTHDYSSDQWFFFEVKFGPYTPDMDSEFGSGTSPYEDLFGGMGLMVKGELDIEVWRPFGTLAVGGEIGWFTKSGKTLTDKGDDTTPTTSTTQSAGDTSINLVPLALLVVYRADFLWDRWSVPVIPYVKLGLNYTFWWITKGDGSTASYKGDSARGGTFGWQFNGGAALLLDVFEPKAAKTMDMETGINHAYIFFEFTHVGADGFGSDTALSVGDTTYQGGLAFEF